ncbi:hypothetical protein KEM48_008986 [Puccinia striiformis f. sp. tritici PST-130]|nr:hypothetical protein KEM48_008986 [Puccinia striiformis f. sp. tritici PST-130]
MTSGGVEWLPPGSPSCLRSATPTQYTSWMTDLHMSPTPGLSSSLPTERELKHIIKTGLRSIYMPPWSYENCKIAKPFSIRMKNITHKTHGAALRLVRRVPRYVLAHASNEYKQW